MDPVTLAGVAGIAINVISAIKPFVEKGVEEVTKTAFKDAYNAIKERLSKKPESKVAIEKFEKDPNIGAPGLQAALIEHLATDHELLRLLAVALEKSGAMQVGSLVNKIEAEKAVVAGKIDTVNM